MTSSVIAPAAPASASTGQRSSSYRADIQGLRGIAVLLVVLYHAQVTGFSGGYIGVDVFFVVSGFVITHMLLRELERTDRVSLGRFYLRRVRRLLPSLGVVLVVVALATVVFGAFGIHQLAARTGGAAAVSAANVYLSVSEGVGYFDLDAELNPFLHTWSLSVEEQFYLVFPGLLLLGWRLARRSGVRPDVIILVGAAVLIVASFAANVWLVSGRELPLIDEPRRFGFFGSPVRAWEFAVGAVLAVARWRRGSALGGPATPAALLGAGLIVWSAATYTNVTPFPGVAALAPVIGTGLLIAYAERSPSSDRLLSSRPLVAIGDISYSWYLWHWPLIVYASTWWPGSTTAKVVAAVISVGPAVAAYRFVENPIRFSPRPSTRNTVLLAVASVLVPVMAVGVLELGHREVADSAGGRELSEFALLSTSQRAGCGSGRTIDDPEQRERCTWHVDDPIGTAVLLGDSNAGQLAEVVVDVMNDAGYAVTVTTMNGCPPVGLAVRVRGVHDPACDSFVARTRAAVREQDYDVVVFAASTDRYLEDDDVALRSRGHWTADTGEKADLWAAQLASDLESLAEGRTVVVVHPIPRFVGWSLRGCPGLRVVVDVASCGTSRDRDALLRRQARSLEVEQRAIAQHEGVVGLDPMDALCPSPSCGTRRGDEFWWRDTHLNAHGGRQLADELRAVTGGVVVDTS